MRVDRRAWIGGLRPGPVGYRRSEVLRGGLGALLGIGLAGLSASLVPGGPAGLPWIVAPMGATAVLLFAAPASPLAQPWPVLMGNTLSTLVGVAAGKLLDDVTLAAAVAVGVAIPLMMVLRCVHPPGGACALFAAVGTSAVADHGWLFALWPVGVDTVVLLAVAAVVNNLTGRPYPHVPEPPAPAPGTDAPPTERVGLRAEDVRAAMQRLDRGLDVLPGDVLALVRDAEAHALDRRLGQLRVGALMARDVRTVQPQETLYRARMLMNQHAVKALPVVDAESHVVGIVTVYDLFNLDVVALTPVSQVMSSPVTTVGEDTPVSELVALMADRGLRHLPVVDGTGRLAGIVTRSELVAVLHRALVGS
ncbi:HPP family protein [Geodermatophilus sp. FMUSA9-8]|uniref:HPP family protein n=1 Tax=Geodermatophilus sp. FMUSA9-8 TaxID=3120155 RepID=UPI003008C42F